MSHTNFGCLRDNPDPKYLSKGDTMSGQTETEYRGYIIRRVPYKPASGDAGCLGFPITHVYKVEDEFGDPGLPELIQQIFWSPADAAQAIDFRVDLGPIYERNMHKWATTLAYEFNNLLRFRRNAVYLLCEVNSLRNAVQEAVDFGDDLPITRVQSFLSDIESVKHRIAGS